MPTAVVNKHLAGNSTFSPPNNPGGEGGVGVGGNDWATVYSCAGHALHKGDALRSLAFAHCVCIPAAFQQMAVECLVFMTSAYYDKFPTWK